MKIAVLDDWQGVARDCADWSALETRAEVEFFQQPFSDDASLITALSDVDIILPMRERTWFSDEVLKALPKLKLFALTGITTKHLNPALCAARGIKLAWSGRYYPEETAEFAFGLMIAAERDIARGDAAIRAGGFQAGTGLGRRMCDLTLGVVGFGNIGKRVAGYANAFGMDVLAWSPSLTFERAGKEGVEAVGLTELLSRSDIVSLHLAMKAETEHIIGAAELAAMRDGALLVNTARGALVDEDALVAELNSGRLRAALDVFETEPLPDDHPLRATPGTLLTPHLGFSTRACFEMFYQECIENIVAWLDGNPIRLLDPPSG